MLNLHLASCLLGLLGASCGYLEVFGSCGWDLELSHANLRSPRSST
jgi:hypothetical protein